MQRLFAVVNSVRSLGRRTFSSGRAHSKAARAGVAVAAVGGVALVAYSQVPDGYNCYSIPDGKKGAFLFEWYKNAVTVTLEGSGAVYRGAVKDGKFSGSGKLTLPDGRVYVENSSATKQTEEGS